MKRRGIKQKFIAYVVFLIIFISFAFLAFFIVRSNSLADRELSEIGFTLAKSLSYSSELAITSEDEIFLRPYLEKTFQESGVVLVALYNKKGQTIISNQKIQAEESISKIAMEAMLKSPVPLKIKNYDQQGQVFYDFYAPVAISEIFSQEPLSQDDGNLAGFARVSLSLDRVATERRSVILIGLSMTLFLIALFALFALLLAEKITKPIIELTKGVLIIGQGSLTYRIVVKTGDEIEDLAGAFNQMAHDLDESLFALKESKQALEIKVQARTRELKELTESLEDKVQDRTKELATRLAELEKFRQITVARELKMIELKKALKQSSDQLAKTEKRKSKKVVKLKNNKET